jgi:hypothetical protein
VGNYDCPTLLSISPVVESWVKVILLLVEILMRTIDFNSTVFWTTLIVFLSGLSYWQYLKNSNMTAMRPLVVPAVKKHSATIIMAHGLGDR